MDNAVSEGMIQGGWGYVWVVYGVTWATLLAYTTVAILRARRVVP